MRTVLRKPEQRVSHIDIHHPHGLPPAQARRAVEDVAARLSQRFGMECRWEGDALHFRRPGVDGRIVLAPGGLHVQAGLGALLAAMRAPIEREVRRVLADRFG
jgi:putative polyhydroxyalkanoate system protein